MRIPILLLTILTSWIYKSWLESYPRDMMRRMGNRGIVKLIERINLNRPILKITVFTNEIIGHIPIITFTNLIYFS